MLLNNLFNIAGHEYTSETMRAVISIDQAHKIFAGHFPGMPVLPGVCMVQVIKEVFELAKGAKYCLTAATNIKFLSVIRPDQYTVIEVLIKYNETSSGEIKLEGSLFSGSVTFFKLMASLRPS